MIVTNSNKYTLNSMTKENKKTKEGDCKMINKILSERRRARKDSGITLIALVVTIVVLIILATVSILAVFGDNGIIARAQTAKDTHQKGKADETNTLDDYASYIGNYLDGKGGSSGGGSDTPTNPTAGTTVAKPGTWTSTEVTPIADGNGGTVPLPSGFYYVGGDISTGLVISDKQGDTMTASGVNMGNQFVWIPVASEADLERTKFDTNGQPTTGLNTTKYTEPYTSGYSTEASEYNTMRTQVLKYGGFYIGRFEAGVNSITLRTKVTVAQTVVCKKGVAPYNYVPWGKAMNDASEVEGESGAVYLAKSMYGSSSSVTSTLTYGCQWDAMCRYIGDSQRTTTTKDSPELTGSVSTDVSKNIYDLAGNCYEWTMEVYFKNYRVLRGGRYSIAYPVSNRGYTIPTGLRQPQFVQAHTLHKVTLNANSDKMRIVSSIGMLISGHF